MGSAKSFITSRNPFLDAIFSAEELDMLLQTDSVLQHAWIFLEQSGIRKLNKEELEFAVVTSAMTLGQDCSKTKLLEVLQGGN